VSHQDRREPLPKGYQFGDGGKSELQLLSEAYERVAPKVGDTMYVRLPRRYRPEHWNVIEGGRHDG